jgi:hypothetical protein
LREDSPLPCMSLNGRILGPTCMLFQELPNLSFEQLNWDLQVCNQITLKTLIKKLWQFFTLFFLFVIKIYNVASHCCEKLLLVILVVQCYYYHLHMLCSHNLSVYYYYNAIKTVSPYLESRYNMYGQNRLRQNWPTCKSKPPSQSIYLCLQ